jgi:hypothetical protein
LYEERLRLPVLHFCFVQSLDATLQIVEDSKWKKRDSFDDLRKKFGKAANPGA